MFCKYLDKKIGTNCPELSITLKMLLLGASKGSASNSPITWHNSTDNQIRALDQPLNGQLLKIR